MGYRPRDCCHRRGVSEYFATCEIVAHDHASSVRMKSLLLVILVTACRPAQPATVHNSASPPKVDATKRATNLVDAMRAKGLTPIKLERIKHEMTYSIGDGPKVRGRELIINEMAGWNAQHSVFARRESDGLIVIVSPWPTKIVDRHVDAGCMTFAGGRQWFEEATYRLAEGEKFGGVVKVEYDEHVVVEDYAKQQPDGSPCPPPALD